MSRLIKLQPCRRDWADVAGEGANDDHKLPNTVVFMRRGLIEN
jgi:hypothetical protein